MARKAYCENTGCKHHCNDNVCDTVVKIGSGGRCHSFEKGFVYYFHLVWDALGNTNYIDAVNMNDDLRIGLYYVMSIYHVGSSEMEWGFCRMIMLKVDEKGPGLKYEEIVARKMDNEIFDKLYAEFQEGKLPTVNKEKSKIETQPFGWLSPSGKFTKGDWGKHEEAAEIIIEKEGFGEEYNKWLNVSEIRCTCRDFLSEVKGYCLVQTLLVLGAILYQIQNL